jgi:hypothetical protein
MPPKKPTTRGFPRAPKLKEVEVGEGYSPSAARQIDFSTKVEPVFYTSTKRVLSHPPAFGDTEASTGSKIVLRQWGHFFNRINWEYYLEFIPHSDPDVRMLDEQLFLNIRRSSLHMVAS